MPRQTKQPKARSPHSYRLGKLIQIRIRNEAVYQDIVARAKADGRSTANFVERALYQHLGITE